ncbi:MAG: o-succinylbenzoate synthase, partial [Actinobacteria bacterium]|nr:o-succinylbenzoate synthase [Actinomycetota bacterium]
MTSTFALRDIFRDSVVVAIPTKTDFRGVSVREALIFRGSSGWSEFAPFVEYTATEAAHWLRAAIEGAYIPWPELKRTSISINATLPRIAPEAVKSFLLNYPGCTTIKMKVNDFESDADRLEAVIDEVPDAKIRLDINGGWTLTQARKYLHEYFLRFGSVFEYIEQPCENLEDLAILKSEVPMKIAVDESIRKFVGSDFTSISDFADIAIMKWAPSGGITDARKIISDIGLPTVISSAVDTGIGITHG